MLMNFYINLDTFSVLSEEGLYYYLLNDRTEKIAMCLYLQNTKSRILTF